ncbi:alpha/beta hydrolase-fold protein [Streptomyces sp. NBC_01239]|uniref:PHB depolymerase family esterase n=1 Tax=Streptomyces sp. NBC_01239 TaxID=2903792 RepID=UPI00225B2ED0|nr:PHB depolymerase family esterase [Streptomyces sp. NBC_01239]MCX4811786.1 alpha/beta hydrolase-fold protein [Streptomyces sp. NBC_01239]
MKSATAITKVYGDGQKFIAVAVEYDTEIDTSKLSASSFEVEGRTVTKVYANSGAAMADQGTDGKYVIVELSPDDKSALLWGGVGSGGGAPGAAQPSASASASAPASVSASASATASSAPSASSSSSPYVIPGPQVGSTGGPATIRAAKGTVTQAGTVTTTGGTGYAAGDARVSTSRTVNLIVDDFQQFTYKDPKTGRSLAYNLYVPKGYDRTKSYPLVLFMHDASLITTTVRATLVQGLGAVCWAAPEDQAERPAFVLAPQYPEVVVGDDYKPTSLFDTTVDLVKALTAKYSIDADRLYATGQSMGAMMTLGLNIKYPDLFAASWVVAGQWPAAQAAPLARKNLWVTVSQGDTKAYPGENAIMAVVEKAGTKVGRAVWDGQSGAAEFAADVKAVAARGTTVNYASFKKGSTLGGGPANAHGVEHNSTWPIAYTIEGVRAWIFEQRKTG